MTTVSATPATARDEFVTSLVTMMAVIQDAGSPPEGLRYLAEDVADRVSKSATDAGRDPSETLVMHGMFATLVSLDILGLQLAE